MISDEQVDNLVQRFMSDYGTRVFLGDRTSSIIIGLRVQRDGIRESIDRVDPGNSRIRWAVVISRRAYSVAAPNSLWHIDGHHSLVTVKRGGIDDFPLINL